MMNLRTHKPVRRRTALNWLTSALAAVTAWPVIPFPVAGSVRNSKSATGWSSYRATADQRGVATCQLPENPQKKWEFKSPDGWLSCVAIVGDHVYAPALSGYVHCLTLSTGEEVWRYRSIEDPDPKKFAPGFKAAPLVTDHVVYIGDEEGTLHALDRATGRKLWVFATSAEIAGCIAKFEDKLLLASHDSYLYCLNKDGREVWKFQTNDRINCSPAISDKYTFLAGCDEFLRVIDLQQGTEVRSMELESPLIASPAIVGDFLYVGTHTGQIVCVDWRKGEFVWRYEASRGTAFHASAAVSDDLVIVGGHDKQVHAIDRSNGQMKWLFPTKAKIESSGAIVDRRIFVGSNDGNLYGISLDTGKEVWKQNCGRGIVAGVAIGEGHLVVGEEQQNGRLFCFG
ncbi:MAG: PQQ-binding-like beta-propeller repeat protein [Planctomycetota bacterium]